MFNAYAHQVLSGAYFRGGLRHEFRFRNFISGVDVFNALEYIRGA